MIRKLFQEPIAFTENGTPGRFQMEPSGLTWFAKAVIGAVVVTLVSAAGSGVGTLIVVARTNAVLVDHQAATDFKVDRIAENVKQIQTDLGERLTKQDFKDAMTPRDAASDHQQRLYDQLMAQLYRANYQLENFKPKGATR